MGRKPNPRGKDRPRSIVLDGDVAEIAEKLAQKSELSATLSELLRHNFGFGDAIEEKKRELQATTDEIQLLQQRSEHIIANIEALETQHLQNQTKVRPLIEKRLRILTDRLAKTTMRRARSFDGHEISRLDGVIREIETLIVAAEEELEALG